jgi:hypothetical protein
MTDDLRTCPQCGQAHDDDDTVVMHSKCHPDTPTWAWYDGAHATLEIRCAECEELVWRVPGVRSPFAPPPMTYDRYQEIVALLETPAEVTTGDHARAQAALAAAVPELLAEVGRLRG